jgi:DNA-binding transcriptional MerR regulator
MREPASLRRIGSVADDAGVTIETLRYYERERLLPRASRTAGGFRLYTQEMAQRLLFIKQARRLGLTLRDIRALVEPDNGCCSVMQSVIAERLADVDRRLDELAAFRSTLQTALERCDEMPDRSKAAACPGVRQLRAEDPPAP